MKIVFVHLDWGIGGAEQLMLQLALASEGHSLELLTTRCDPDHCFAHLRAHPPHVCGSWIPASIGGRFQAVLSTLRLFFLAIIVVVKYRDADLIVTDVLPTPLWVLRYFTNAALLFYCHFPDRLLIRNTNPSRLFRLYRYMMDTLESFSMDLADTVVVNSKFTQEIVRESFPHLRHRALPVLYPALEETQQTTNYHRRERRIVSLNRFERKKNLRLLIDAVRYLQTKYPSFELPSIVIAGGYDSRNVENVEHRAELGQLVKEFHLETFVTFEHSITDTRRHELLTTATAVAYTPDCEHFGIVPVEAMATGTPVVCCRSGGPKETVLDGITGYLCDPPTDQTFGEALKKLLDDPDLVERMGAAGKKHAIATFGMDRLKTEWKEFIATTVELGRKRVSERHGFRISHSLVYLAEATAALMICALLTLGLRSLGILREEQSLLSGTKKLLGFGDEL